MTNNSYAEFKIVDTYCNENYSIQPWKETNKSAIPMKDFIKNSNEERKRIINALNNLPIVGSSDILLKEMKIAPFKKRTRSVMDFYKWQFENEKEHFFVNVQYYKGCLNEISLSYMQKPISFESIARYVKSIKLSNSP